MQALRTARIEFDLFEFLEFFWGDVTYADSFLFWRQIFVVCGFLGWSFLWFCYQAAGPTTTGKLG